MSKRFNGKVLGKIGLVLVGLVIVGAFGGRAWYFAACNDSQHDRAWLLARIDESIGKGYEYLYQSKKFLQPVRGGGELPIHHLVLDLALAREPHAGLETQKASARASNRGNPQWTIWNGLTDYGPMPEKEAEWTLMQRAVDETPNNFSAWFLAVAYAQRLERLEGIHQKLFHRTDQLKTIYDLTHALMSYWFIEQHQLEGLPSADVIADAKRRVNERLMAQQAWAPTVGDAFIEVVAVWALDGEPEIRQRWIERILEAQNADGGWVTAPSYLRRVQGLLGLPQREEASEIHPTFLALLALTCYRDQLTVEGSVD